MDMNITYSLTGTSIDPSVFGPPMWFTFHNGAILYPKRPTDYVKNGMKQFLSNIPLVIPCLGCKEHMYDLLSRTNLDEVVSSRESLFKFWVDAHNYVNKRYGKRQMSLAEAKILYGFDKPEIGTPIRITYSGILPNNI